MQMNRLLTGIYNVCRWITHFFYLNVLWVGFTLLGGILLGIMPSTIALYSIARKTAMGEEDIPITKTFWHVYRKEFLRSNRFGAMLLILALLITFNLFFFRSFEGSGSLIMSFLMLLIAVVFIILLFYVFPVYVHYKLSLFEYLKQALIIAFLHPANLIAMIITCVTAYYFFIYLPGFIPLFGITFLCHLNMWLAYQCFQSIERMTEKTHTGRVAL
ncbi:YesL family protein [Bacillus sp. FJAT-50079]|uniref:YesL family protein n=1 Tax=Bacillus sp. FJAT-50079 TaxID=2833577 RepID=UPI001BC8E5C4|nr:YesL family protein [Bacillus sp. FJAT-50079]MBS4209428.1 YesL family protein [Bacillus sp. FJAT-50079]